MNKIKKVTQTLVLVAIIVYSFTGCGTTDKTTTMNKNPATPISSYADKFYNKNNKLIEAVENYQITSDIKDIKGKLKEGYNFKLFWLIPVNASTDGLTYSEKFLEKKNGSVEIVVDEKGRGNMILSILF